MKFTYTVKSKDNKVREGTLQASDKSEAKALLKRRGLRIISLVAEKKLKLMEGEQSVVGDFLIKDSKGNFQIVTGNPDPKPKEVIVFTKQLATMIASGVPLITALGVLEKQQKTRGFYFALRDIREALEQGSTLSAALAKYPKIFDALYVAMVEAGEVSGNLDVILKKLVEYTEKAERIKSQVRSALAYPIIVLFVAIGVVSGLLFFVVPIFAQQFAETGRQLPFLTQFIIDISNDFTENWHFIVSGSVIGFFLFRYWIKTPQGRESFDKYILKSPIIGDVLKKIAIGRFSSTMSSMLSSGVNLLEALSICAASSGNKTVENFILNVKHGLEKGLNFSVPLGEGDLIPDMVVSMVEVGESTGALDDMLQKVSDLYEEEVDIAVNTMLSMIEPIMIVFIGGIIAFVVIAMYLPIFDMAGGIA